MASPAASTKTPKSPKPLITESPKALSTPQSENPSKGLNILLQNAAANATTASPISAIFLVQFDVKSGYVLKWSKTINKNISLKGVEFKSLPSGLHEVERDVISFVQIHDHDDVDDDGNEIDTPDPEAQPFDKLLYGVSVFHQNLKESAGGSRNKVKMFSLGILVDPLSQINTKSTVSKFSGDLPTWRPMQFTSGLEYVDQLHKLLDEWDNSKENYTKFEDFFEKHSPKMKLLDVISAKSPKRNVPKIDTTTLNTSLAGKHHSHHFLLHLSSLLEALGPLIFKVWRSALLREKILLFDAPTVELTCAYTYCLAILSTIPQEIHWLLNESGCWATSALQFIQPIYSIGVNDIDWLKTLVSGNSAGKNTSFIASSTDEILLFKTALYDLSVQFNQPHHVATKIPKLFPSEASIPGSKITDPLKATQRDLKRFKILAREFDLYNEDSADTSIETTTVNSSKSNDEPDILSSDHPNNSQVQIDSEGIPWWAEVSEAASWRQLAWSGFYWWASAGENEKIEEEQEIEGLKEIGDNKNEIDRSLILVGYFQNMTKRLFTTIADIINNENEEDSKADAGDLNDVGDGDELVNEKIIWIEPADIFEMGLDPYSKQDAEFVVKLIQVWWDRKAHVGSKIVNLCCF